MGSLGGDFGSLLGHFGVTFGCMRVTLVSLLPIFRKYTFPPMIFNDFLYIFAYIGATWGAF